MEMAMKDKQTLFIRDDKTGKIEITDFARRFYKAQKLDAKEMAKQWEQRLLQVLTLNDTVTNR
jgi:hypothetical protein